MSAAEAEGAGSACASFQAAAPARPTALLLRQQEGRHARAGPVEERPPRVVLFGLRHRPLKVPQPCRRGRWEAHIQIDGHGHVVITVDGAVKLSDGEDGSWSIRRAKAAEELSGPVPHERARERLAERGEERRAASWCSKASLPTRAERSPYTCMPLTPHLRLHLLLFSRKEYIPRACSRVLLLRSRVEHFRLRSRDPLRIGRDSDRAATINNTAPIIPDPTPEWALGEHYQIPPPRPAQQTSQHD